MLGSRKFFGSASSNFGDIKATDFSQGYLESNQTFVRARDVNLNNLAANSADNQFGCWIFFWIKLNALSNPTPIIKQITEAGFNTGIEAELDISNQTTSGGDPVGMFVETEGTGFKIVARYTNETVNEGDYSIQSTTDNVQTSQELEFGKWHWVQYIHLFNDSRLYVDVEPAQLTSQGFTDTMSGSAQTTPNFTRLRGLQCNGQELFSVGGTTIWRGSRVRIGGGWGSYDYLDGALAQIIIHAKPQRLDQNWAVSNGRPHNFGLSNNTASAVSEWTGGGNVGDYEKPAIFLNQDADNIEQNAGGLATLDSPTSGTWPNQLSDIDMDKTGTFTEVTFDPVN